VTNASRLKSIIAIAAVGVTAAALLLSQINLAYVIANELVVCKKSATPSGLLASHFGFAWPWLALLAFQTVGLLASRFFWLSILAGAFVLFYATGEFDIVFLRGGILPPWECTDWSFYDGTFLDRAMRTFVLVPLLFLFALTGLAELLLAFVIRTTGVERPALPHPIDWALSKLSRLIAEEDIHGHGRGRGRKSAGPESDL
jgi:hypothetical protein